VLVFHDLTKKDKKLEFGPAQLEAFDELKSKLLKAPISALYSPEDDTELHCNASFFFAKESRWYVLVIVDGCTL